jgi:drug/metabolite transporter (DMT)-like permease
MLIGVIAALVACFSYGTASVLQSHAARRGGDAAVTAPTFRSTVTAILAPLFLAGMLLDGLGFLGSLVSARLIPLFLSQTIMSANLAVTAVLSVLVLGVRPRDWAAIAIVLAALCVLGFSAGELGTEVPGRHMHWSVLAASVLIFVFGVVLVRVLGKKAAVPAGLIAGILYGAMAVAVRITHGLDPFQWHALVSDPAAWAVLVAGGGGFYLFTVALQIGSVNGVAAALVMGETVIPGVVGVLLLGDVAKPGLGWLVGVAFATAVAGAVAIAIFGAAEEEPAAVPV